MLKAKPSPLKPTAAIRRVAVATLFCGLLIATTVLLPPNAAKAKLEAEMAGVSAAVTGNVTLSKVTGEVGILVESGMPVYLGDRIITSNGAGLQVLLLDETVLTIGPNSDVAIDEFVYDPTTGDGRIVADMAKGVMRFVTGKIPLNNPSSMDVNLPVGSIGIRGTIGLIRSMTAEQANHLVPGNFDTADENTANQLVFMAVNQGPGLLRTDTTSRPGAFAVFNRNGNSQSVTGENFGVFVSNGRVTTPTRFPISAATFDFSANAMRTASRRGGAGATQGASPASSAGQQPVITRQQTGQAQNQTGVTSAQAIDVAMAQMGTVNSTSNVAETTSILNNNLVDNTGSPESEASSTPFTFDGIQQVSAGTASISGSSNASSGSLSYQFNASVDFSNRTLSLLFTSIRDSGTELTAIAGSAEIQDYNFDTPSSSAAVSFGSSGIADFGYGGGCATSASAAGCSATATFADLNKVDFKLTTNAEPTGASGTANLN